MRRGRAHEGNGTVGAQEVGAGGVPRTETAVNRSVRVRGEVVVRTVDTVGEVGVRSLVVVGPPRRDRAPNVTATGGGGGAEVRAVVALRPVVGGRILRVADVQTVDRDVLFADDDLVGRAVDDARECREDSTSWCFRNCR